MISVLPLSVLIAVETVSNMRDIQFEESSSFASTEARRIAAFKSGSRVSIFRGLSAKPERTVMIKMMDVSDTDSLWTMASRMPAGESLRQSRPDERRRKSP